MEEARRLADRVGLLADGRLVAVDSPEQLIADHGGESLLVIDGVVAPELTEKLPYEATITDGELVVQNVPPEEIGAVIDRLTAHGVTYQSLTWREPDLEDVYLELTDSRPDGVATKQRQDDWGRAEVDD
jgi:ABC-2 type transport system ATP-binding protein